MVLFVPLFALLFILIYKPLDFDTLDEKLLPWLNIDYDLKITLLSIVIVLIGMAVAAISRLIMTSYARSHALSYVKYISWVALEIPLLRHILKAERSAILLVFLFVAAGAISAAAAVLIFLNY